jgi:hypothetical protein
MVVDLMKFQGTLPYASELFGVYQPLIGWRSDKSKSLAASESSKNIQNLLAAMAHDSRVRKEIGKTHAPVGPDDLLPPAMPNWLNKALAVQIQSAATKFQVEHRRLPNADEWKSLLGAVPLARTVATLTSALLPDGRLVDDTDMRIVDRDTLSAKEIQTLRAVNIPESHYAMARTTAQKSNKTAIGAGVNAAMQAGTLAYLAQKNPRTVSAVLVQKASWEAFLNLIDPLATFNPDTQDAVLSPVGTMQIFRQYFFEFDSFLGPPVGHVWISPGSSLELFEVHTRKTIEQREVETRAQSISKSEKAELSEDELANKVNTDNSTNISFGITASAGVNFGIVQANASASFGYNSTQKTSQEQAHKHSRKQSEKFSNELRRDFKTTFRTTVEQQDTSSKRYVLQNGTAEIMNIELRRKMRQVGVQVQHIGTQLCWQLYVDDPGARLAIPELVHIAKQGDLNGDLQPPEAPPAMDPIEKDFDALFPYLGDPDEMDEVYDNGKEESSAVLVPTPFGILYTTDGGATIKSQIDFPVTAPPGYYLDHVNLRDVQGTGSDGKIPSPVFADCTAHHANGFKSQWVRITLTQVNFQDNPALRFLLSLTFQPTQATTDAAQAAFNQKMAEYKQATQRAQHEEYVRAVRERIKLAGDVTQRSSDDLRAEERSSIFQSLIRKLLLGAGDETPHVTVELMRAIFDIDKMLYFVAESWWTPVLRKYPHIQLHSKGSSGERLTRDDVFGWGGFQSAGHNKYHITEESNPAPLGASLGWLLQLDGDKHRNAFLNSPFVKAVIPIRIGHEKAALEWLERGVEGSDGLDVPYRGTEPEYKGKTMRQVLLDLAGKIGQDNADMAKLLQTETVYENGFDPLQGGFNATPAPFAVFDQWVEVLPTEQVVAVNVAYDSKTGKML